MDFESCYRQIENYINNTDKITAKALCDEYEKALKDRFVDNHFRFHLPMDKDNPMRFPARKHFLPYFSGITVAKEGDTFTVISSCTEAVKVGDVIADTGCMYPTLPREGKGFELDYWLDSDKPIEEITQWLITMHNA